MFRSRPRAWRRLLAFTMSIAMASAPVLPARAVDPITIAAGAALASTVIKMGANKSSLQLELALAQLEMLQAVHARLDTIEASIAEILKQVADLPEEVAKKQRQESEANQALNVLGILDTLKQEIDLAAKTGKRLRSNPQIEMNLVLLSNALNTLRRHSDNVAPSLIANLVTEVSVRKSFGAKPDEIANILEIYDARFALMLDKGRAGSLANTLNRLRDLHLLGSQQIADALGLKGDTLMAGEVPWYSHTNLGLRPDTITVEEVHLRGTTDAFLSSRTVDVMVPYPQHSRTWSRIVSVWSIDEEFGATKVRITPRMVQTEGELRGAPQHQASDRSYEKTWEDQHKALLSLVEVFNKEADSIRLVADTLRLVVITRETIKDWDPDAVEKLKASADRTKNVADQLDEAAELKRKKSVAWLVEQMDRTRIDAWDRIKASNERIRAVADRAKADKWRSDLVMLLDLAAASAQFASAVNSEIIASKLRSAADLAKTMDASETKVATSKTEQAAPEQREGAAAPAGGGGPVLPPRAADIDAMAPLQKVDRVESLLREIRAMPNDDPSSGKGLSPKAEKIVEALAILDTMGPTAADEFHTDNQKTVAQIVFDAAKDGLIAKDIGEFQKTILVESVKPTVLMDGTRESIHHQNQLRGDLNAELGRLILVEDPSLDLQDFIEWQMKLGEQCKDGCVLPMD